MTRMNRAFLLCASAASLLALACSGRDDADPEPAGSSQLSVPHEDGEGAAATGPSGAPVDLGADIETIDDPSLPLIHNASGAPRDRVMALVRAALDGLGFEGAEAPNHQDRVFVGKNYLAWIDQTGFYGKMNGLWVLDGAANPEFVNKDFDGRPVNQFIPGESGEGNFAPGYKGGEHVEFPNRNPEANDNPSCGNNDWCNQYGLNEAPAITDPDIPWWSACNAGRTSFSTKFEPVVVERVAGGGLKLIYEGPLVKEADGDRNYDGDSCHQDYLFPDKVRRRVNLRVGYVLYPDRDYVDRTQQVANPAGNPTFKGDMSLIGGFVMTQYPNPHYLKRFDRFWRAEDHAVDTWGGFTARLNGGVWTDLRSQPAPRKDVGLSWAKQPFSVSGTNEYAAGRSVTVSHEGPSDNDDLGGCLCVVHGGIELGGGLIHEGISLPLEAGKSTIEAVRRLRLPNTIRRGTVSGRKFRANDELRHAVGHPDGDGWYAATGPDGKGHIVYGPYARDWGGGTVQAAFSMMVDDNDYDNDVVVTLDIRDQTTDTVIASRDIRRREFRRPQALQRFVVNADLAGRSGHEMETRVFWHDISYVKVSQVSVSHSDL